MIMLMRQFVDNDDNLITVHLTWEMDVTIFTNDEFAGRGAFDGRQIEDYEGDEIEAETLDFITDLLVDAYAIAG